MKTIYLIRHGKIDNPQGIFYSADASLGSQGTHQAQALAADIRDAKCNPVRIICSPYVRTRETAEIIAQALEGHEVEIDERLVEWQVGNWYGKPLESFRKAAGYGEEPFHLKLKDIEPFEKASARVIAALHDLLDSMEDDTCALAISHREPMVAAILKLQGKTDWTDIPHLDFLPGSCWKLDFEKDALQQAAKAFDRSKSKGLA